MFKKFFERKKKRIDAVNKARQDFTSWFEISASAGWIAYEERINKKIEFIDNQFHNDTSLKGEDLKNLQLAYQIWKEAKRIPKDLKDNAKAGGK